MSVSVTKIVSLPQAALKFLVEDEIENTELQVNEKTIGGVLVNTDYAWLARGPRLEIVHNKTGNKVGAWSFGWILKDSNTKVVNVDEIQRPHGRLPLLAVALDCDLSGGMICIFDFVTSKVIRAIHVTDKITSLHVIDSGYDIFTLPGPLRNFDGVIAVGTAGGDVLLVDICRQICDEALTTGGLNEIRDELNPCELFYITSEDLSRIEHHKEFAIRNSHHLAIHLNVVHDKSTKHFTLKGPKGDDRIHVNKDEVTVSALYYCPQLGSLLVGYNFGALQLYNLMNLELVYTSPVCDEHIPITHFSIQEPADDPRSVCYVWAVYSCDDQYPTCLPLAVMYAFCYHTKEYHEGYGFLYQDFSNAAVHYQMELGIPEGHQKPSKIRGGNCLKLNSITQGAVNREGPSHDSNEETLTLSVFVWNVLFSNKEIHTFLAVFDLNQWYKEQMPSVMNVKYCSTYMLHIYLNDLINSATNKVAPILYVHVDPCSIQQYMGPQRLEEHFYPNSLTFGMTCLRDVDVIFLHNYGVQKALLAQIESSGPLCLVQPADIYQEVVGLGLVPLFIDLPVNLPISTNQQREVILGAALENQLMGWLCKCASEWANGSFLSTGCSLDLLINWAFQRAITLKTNCDNFCVPLFDYSETRLDNNTNILLNSCTRQLKNLYSLYEFIINKFSSYIFDRELVNEQYNSLETVSVYFEVLQWLLNVGLLPECPLSAYPRTDDLDRISAPYPAEKLIEFYNHRRALLKIANEENFSSSDSVLFIDALIENECGGKILQEQWLDDGGNGLYPPPSLQALLRTYLINNVNLSYKHSVIIYVFLDLAMTLDQNRYKPVITHLIKFPAVFKVSPSVIKITQAFWQLDHSDCNTAVGLLLDPLITPQDLKPWHHKIVLRSLILQKQHNFALLYVRVRKPEFTNDEDLLCEMSLYVANNMLDEAFYFRKQLDNSQSKNEKFMTHFLDECKKKGKLRPLIYHTYTPTDENLFLNYLRKTKDTTCESLIVCYHIVRAQFLEAFTRHESSLPVSIESLGLSGQQHATVRDKIIQDVKTALPDVYKELLDVCSKDKHYIWQQVPRPTPMSVFVHNTNENVLYKSGILRDALHKARQTFNETVNKQVETEAIPFLRTPIVSKTSRRSSAVIINPKTISVEQESIELTPPSAKRLKLSQVSSPLPSKLSTPLIKRKTPKSQDTSEVDRTATPHSILKVRSFISETPVKVDAQFKDNFEEFEKVQYTPVNTTPKKSGLGLSPRRSLPKHSPVVRFEGVQSSSSDSLNQSRTLTGDSGVNTSNLESSAIHLSESSKNTSTEDEFHSVNTSLEDKAPTEEVCEVDKTQEEREISVASENATLISKESPEEKQPTTTETEKVYQSYEEEIPKENSSKEDSEDLEEKQPTPLFSPKGRRSYKRSLGQSTPIRSSPRLSRSMSHTEKVDDVQSSPSTEPSPDNQESQVEQTEELPKSSPILPKLRARKSLCRKVLETNAISRMRDSLSDSPIRKSVTTETRTEIVTESYKSFEESNETREISSIASSSFDSTSTSFFAYNTSELKLSDSILSYINNREFGNKKTTDTEENIQAREEAMEVDDDIVVSEVATTDNKDEDVSSKTLSEEEKIELVEEKQKESFEVTAIDEKENQEQSFELIATEEKEDLVYEDISSSKIPVGEKNEVVAQGKSEKKEKVSFADESTTNGPVDPEMNVFEISDDLSFNDGLVIEKEVRFEEDDLCYGQQSTLKGVLEDTLDDFEKNVFTEEVNSEECTEGHENENIEQSETSPVRNEVIEIGSSSEEDNKISDDEFSHSNSEHSSEERDSKDELNVSYESYKGNIYDSFDDDNSSESSYERHYSEISEISEDETKGCGLFQGEIVVAEEPDKETKTATEKVEEKPDTKSNEDKTAVESSTVQKQNDEDVNVTEVNEKVEETLSEKPSEQGEIKDSSEQLNESFEMEELHFSSHSEDSVLQEKKEGDVSEPSKHPRIPEGENKDQQNVEDETIETCTEEGSVTQETRVDTVDEITEISTKKASVTEESQIVEPDTAAPQVTPEKLLTQESQSIEEQDPLDIVEDVVPSETEIQVKDVDSSENVTENLVDQVTITEEVVTSETETQVKCIDSSEHVAESSVEQDPLDTAPETKTTPEKDVVEQLLSSKDKQEKKSRKKSSSASHPVGRRVTRSKSDVLDPATSKVEADVLEELLKPRKSSKIDDSTPKVEPDVLEELLKPRSLRSRRVSTEEVSKPVVTLRKRSASVDEATTKESVKKEEQKGKQKRGGRAASVSHLPKIPEESEITNKKSVLEGRRVTRAQLSLLKEMESKVELGSMDPIVLLDKLPFDGKPDPEEQKVYDTSPSPTTSISSSPVKRSRRLRSASQTSNTSQRSKSKTPTRVVKSVSRKKSTDEISNTSTRSSTVKKKLSETIDDVEQDTPKRVTRSRTKSESSINSDDSNVSESTKLGKRRRVTSQKPLPEIKEEPSTSEKTTIPKKRTRKNSSQI